MSGLLSLLTLGGVVLTGAFVGAGAAVADDEVPQHQGGASATLDGLTTFDTAVLHGDGGDQEISAGLFEMTVDGGGALKTYGIDMHSPAQDDSEYVETSWEQTSLGTTVAARKNAGRILWILGHSYPQVDDLTALAKAAGSGPLTDRTAAAGTQVAIWRLADGARVDAKDPAARKLARYLQKHAKLLAEPEASLTLEPSAVSGLAGETIGPVTVHTDADGVTVTPPVDAAASGVRIVDKNGAPISTAVNGTRLYFAVPSASEGTASLGVQATTSVPVGRAFTGVGRGQTQIMASSSDTTVSAAATVNWARKGPIPAVTAEENCTKGGVDVTAANNGDQAYTFTLAGLAHTVEAGVSRIITVPVDEDGSYSFTITGPAGFTKTFSGVLDCKPAGTTAPAAVAPSAGSDPTPAGGAGAVVTDDESLDLADTGESAVTPLMAGIAVCLVMIGGGMVFTLRRKGTRFDGE